MSINFEKVREELKKMEMRSAWEKGVYSYALELLETVEDEYNRGNISDADLGTSRNIETALLNGASDWNEFSYGGCSLIYNGDIAERLCTPSELKKKDGGRLQPNRCEDWIDVQTRALRWAKKRIIRAFMSSGYIK